MVIVIAILLSVALKRYSNIAREAEILRLEVIASHFATGAVNARIEFLMKAVARQSIRNDENSGNDEIIPAAKMATAADSTGDASLNPDSASGTNSSDAVTQVAAPNSLIIDNTTLYMTDQGWPASVNPQLNSDLTLSDADCKQLWLLLLQNPAPITEGQFSTQSQFSASKRRFRAYSLGRSCRYALTSAAAFFDYFPESGRTQFNVSNNEAAK